MTTTKKVLVVGALYLIWREWSAQQAPGGSNFQTWQTNPGSAVPVWVQQMSQIDQGDGTSTTTSTEITNPFVNPGGLFCP